MAKVNVLILLATGTNRDPDAAAAIELAGGVPDVVPVNALRDNPAHLHDYQMLVLPGGFSYGDALGAGRLLATDMRWLFEDEMAQFIGAGKPVIGICNGFQTLVKSGWLPGPADGTARATLTRNQSNRFECRWVYLRPNVASPCVFTEGLETLIHCPVAHGEGRFVPRDAESLSLLQWTGQIVLSYVDAQGQFGAGYPHNPNGSTYDIAGICNEQGNVFGLMPHPEDHIFTWQHPRHNRGESGQMGLPLFVNGVRYAAGL